MVIKKNKKPNIVLITIDSLRGDYVNYENMPNLMDLIDKQGIAVFDAYTAGVPTYYAFPSIMCGVYPFKYGISIGTKHCKKTLAEIFKEAGYTTIGVSAGNPHTSRYWGYDRGFDYFQDYIRPKKKRSVKEFLKKRKILYFTSKKFYSIISTPRDKMVLFFKNYFPTPTIETILEEVKKILPSVDNASPFFLWIHLMDVHLPYFVDKRDLTFKERLKRVQVEERKKKIFQKLISLLKNNLESDPVKLLHKFTGITKEAQGCIEFLLVLYTKSIRRLDRNLLVFIDYITSVNPNTIFLITSDHGEEFLDNMSFFHFPLFHNDSVVKIPLILIGDKVVNG